MKCLICNKENEKYVCKTCLENNNIKDIINNLRLNQDIEYEDYNNIILEITETLPSPLKEYYLIMSDVKKFYSVTKDKREYLIENISICLESDLITDKDKTILKTLLLDAYCKNYQFALAEPIANNLKETELDEISLYGLGDYYIFTRRYDLAKELLNKAIEICQNEDTKVSIYNKLVDCEARRQGKENGGKRPYLPSTQENRIIYQEFMRSIGIDVELPKIRAKAPESIDIADYPVPVELKNAGFKSFVAFDIETTGIDHNRDSIIELAAIRVIDGKIIESKEFIFQELVHPYKKRISPIIEDLTGITNEMVYDSREIWEVFKDFAEFIQDDILLGYNCMTFDSKFLVRAGRLSNVKIENKYFDVMNYIKKFQYKLNYDKKTLTNISTLLGITNPNAHRALADAITTAKVYLKLLEIDDDLC